MIFLVYGEDEVSVLNETDKILRKLDADERINLGGAELTKQTYTEAVLTPNMFGFSTAIVTDASEITDDLLIELLETATKASGDKSTVFTTSKTFRKNSRVLKAAKKIKDLKIIEVKKQKDSTIFSYINAVFEGKREQAYKLLEELSIKDEPAFKTQAMLVYQLRNLARTKFGAKVSAPPFVQRKLQKLAGHYTKEKIVELYRYFYETDRDMKLGKVPETMLNVLSMEKVMEARK